MTEPSVPPHPFCSNSGFFSVTTDKTDAALGRSKCPLHGREEELQTLLELAQKISHHPSDKTKNKDGTTRINTNTTSTCSSCMQICLVHGLSGTGKTALCRQLQKEINANRGAVFVTGKFDQYHRDASAAPYSAAVQAFHALGQELLDHYHDINDTSDDAIQEQPETSAADSTNGDKTEQGPSAVVAQTELDNDREKTVVNSSRVPFREQLQDFLANEGGILTKLIPSMAMLLAESKNYIPEASSKEGAKEKHIEHEGLDGEGSSNIRNNNEKDQQQQGQNRNSSSPSSTTSLQQATGRLAVAIRSLLRLVCTEYAPVILFFDDIQWLDHNSLDLLSLIVNGESPSSSAKDTNDDNVNNIQIEHFLLLLGCRDCLLDDDEDDFVAPEERGGGRRFLNKLNRHNSNGFFVTDIQLENLHLAAVHAMVSDMLSTTTTTAVPEDHDDEKRKLEGFVQLVYETTLGNPFHVKQLLGIFQKQGLLKYNFVKDRWEWADPEQILSQTDNVAFLVSKRIQSLSSGTRRILKLAACLGFSVDVDLLEDLTLQDIAWRREQQEHPLEECSSISSSGGSGDAASTHDSFQKALSKAEAEEMIELTGSTCKFSHDRIQQCCYELMPMGKIREEFHLRTGKHIKGTYSARCSSGADPDDQLLFLAADQCNRGSSCISGEEERLEILRLNLEASQAARRNAGVALCAEFLDKAVELIQDSDWAAGSSSYPLILEIYSLSAEVESARGRFDISDKRVETILQQAKHPHDTIRATTVKAYSLCAKTEFLSAVAETRKALHLLGVKIPPSGRVRVMMELWKTRRMLRNKTELDYLMLEPMTDARMLFAMSLLQMGSVYGWNSDVYFGALCYIWMIRITVVHGRCQLTAFACAGFGNLLVNVLGKETEGAWFGQVATRLDAGKTIPGTILLVHSYLSHLRLPVSASLDPFLSAYRVSLESGDIVLGAICLIQYSLLYFYCGLPLAPYSMDLRRYCAELKLCRQEFLLQYLLTDLQFALNLTGQSSNPMTISWEEIRKSGIMTDNLVPISEEDPAELNIQYTQMFNSIILGDLKRAESALLRVLSRPKDKRRYSGCQFGNLFLEFWDGLVCISLLRKRWKRTYARIAKRSIAWLTRASERGSLNCVGMLQLLKAEKASLQLVRTGATVRSAKSVSSIMAAKTLYDNAISQLTRSGFNHFAAIASERVGEFMLECADHFWAVHYLSQAVSLYGKWGASVKVNRLLERHPFLNHKDRSFSNDNIPEVAIRSRPRYDRAADSTADHLLLSSRSLLTEGHADMRRASVTLPLNVSS